MLDQVHFYIDADHDNSTKEFKKFPNLTVTVTFWEAFQLLPAKKMAPAKIQNQSKEK